MMPPALTASSGFNPYSFTKRPVRLHNCKREAATVHELGQCHRNVRPGIEADIKNGIALFLQIAIYAGANLNGSHASKRLNMAQRVKCHILIGCKTTAISIPGARITSFSLVLAPSGCEFSWHLAREKSACRHSNPRLSAIFGGH